MGTVRQFGADFELPDVMPDETRLREQYLIPALRAVAERWQELGAGKLAEPELPKGIERAELLRDVEGLPCVRFTAAWAYINEGTEEEPDWQFRHVGRIDAILEHEPRSQTKSPDD